MTHGMVVAPQPEAVEAGAIILKEGGNAVDAGIACALVQGVVDPQMTGIAGFGSLQAYTWFCNFLVTLRVIFSSSLLGLASLVPIWPSSYFSS
jgi:hypothetical protein